MLNQQDKQSTSQDSSKGASKSPYNSPVLKVFGSVGKLTKGNNGSFLDVVNGSRK